MQKPFIKGESTFVKTLPQKHIKSEFSLLEKPQHSIQVLGQNLK